MELIEKISRNIQGGLKGVLDEITFIYLQAVFENEHSDFDALIKTVDYFKVNFGGIITRTTDDESTTELISFEIKCGFGYFGDGRKWIWLSKAEFIEKFDNKYQEFLREGTR